MTKINGDKPRTEQFLDALVEELRTMSDTDALEGENAEELVKLGERLLKNARQEAGTLRMASAKRKLSLLSDKPTSAARPSVAEAKKYLESHPTITLAARKLDDLSDEDVLDLFSQAKRLEEASDSDAEDRKE